MRDWFKTVLEIVWRMALIALLFALTRLAVTFTNDQHQTQIALQQTMAEAQSTLHSTGTTVESLASVVEESHKAVRQARTLIDVALKTSLAERTNVQKSSDETVALLGNAEHLVANLDYRTKVLTDSLTLTANQAQQTLQESSKAMDAAAGLISDPSIHRTLTNLDTVSDNAAKSTTDFQIKFHQWLFPPPEHWYQKAWNFSKFGAETTYTIFTLKP